MATHKMEVFLNKGLFEEMRLRVKTLSVSIGNNLSIYNNLLPGVITATSYRPYHPYHPYRPYQVRRQQPLQV